MIGASGSGGGRGSPRAAAAVDSADLAQIDQGVNWTEGIERCHLVHKTYIFKHYVASLVFQGILFVSVYASIAIQNASHTHHDAGADGAGSNAEFLVILVLTFTSFMQLKHFGDHRKAAFGRLPGMAASDAEIQRAFGQWDANGDGVLSVSEITGVLEALGATPSRAKVKEMMAEAGAKDERLDLRGFRAAIKSAGSELWAKASDGIGTKMAALDSIRWHGRMCFVPVMMMLLCTIMACMSASSLLYHFSHIQGDDIPPMPVCATSMSVALRHMSFAGKLCFVCTWASLPFLYFFLMCLSLVHFKIYQALTDANANPGDSESEMLSPRSGGRGALALAHDSKTFTLSRMQWSYISTMVLQVAIYSMLSHSMERVNPSSGAGVGANTTTSALDSGSASAAEPSSWSSSAADVILSEQRATTLRTLYIMIAAGVFHLGQQSGTCMDYLKYGAECKLGDRFQVKRRVTWHGRMMYSPCVVAVLQCFIFFYCAFTLLPYYRKEDAVCTQDLISNLSGFDGDTLLGIGVMALVFVLLILDLVWLCIAHFHQFRKYQMALL